LSVPFYVHGDDETDDEAYGAPAGSLPPPPDPTGGALKTRLASKGSAAGGAPYARGVGARFRETCVHPLDKHAYQACRAEWASVFR